MLVKHSPSLPPQKSRARNPQNEPHKLHLQLPQGDACAAAFPRSQDFSALWGQEGRERCRPWLELLQTPRGAKAPQVQRSLLGEEALAICFGSSSSLWAGSSGFCFIFFPFILLFINIFNFCLLFFRVVHPPSQRCGILKRPANALDLAP